MYTPIVMFKLYNVNFKTKLDLLELKKGQHFTTKNLNWKLTFV